MIKWQFYPKTLKLPEILQKVIQCFEKNHEAIKSPSKTLSSNEVLEILRPHLKKIGFEVEHGKKKEEKIQIPVLFGLNGAIEKSFEVDAYHEKTQTIIEIEAGRAYLNNQFLKDLFEAWIMENVDYLCIAVRNVYKNSNDFDKILAFFNTLYASNRFNHPLKGVLLIGY